MTAKTKYLSSGAYELIIFASLLAAGDGGQQGAVIRLDGKAQLGG